MTLNPGVKLLARADGLVLRLDTSKGRGVFASKFIPKGTVVEVSPVLVFTEDEVQKHTSQTCLQHYTYYWPSEKGNASLQAIALGLGSMFNHSTARQNIVWKRELETECLIYSAHRDIFEGEELCISYGNARLWFVDADAVDADDEWNRLRKREENMTDTIELELSGLGNIEL